MALTNNLVVSLKDHSALAEALAQRQPGDKLVLDGVQVTLVENLTERASFDVDAVGAVKGRDAEVEVEVELSPESQMLADSVMGVMAKKSKAA